jgi:hypothetical protein
MTKLVSVFYFWINSWNITHFLFYQFNGNCGADANQPIKIEVPIDGQEFRHNKIHEEEGDPVHDQRLIFEGRMLDDKKTLANYNILENTTIHLVRRMQGN